MNFRLSHRINHSSSKRGRKRKNSIIKGAKRLALICQDHGFCAEFFAAFADRSIFNAGKGRHLSAGFSDNYKCERDLAARSFDERVLFSVT